MIASDVCWNTIESFSIGVRQSQALSSVTTLYPQSDAIILIGVDVQENKDNRINEVMSFI